MSVVAGAPALSADIAALVALTTGKPLVRLQASGTQSLTHNTAAAIVFSGVDVIDTHSFHDPSTNNTRVTPSVAGYYTVRGTVFFGARTDYTITDCWIRFNGSSNLAPAGRHSKGTTSSQADSASTEVLWQFNGTTDYIELMGLQANGASAAQNTNQSSQFSSILELIFERS